MSHHLFICNRLVTSLLVALTFTLGSRSEDTIKLFSAGASLPSTVYTAWLSAFENSRQEFVKLDTEYLVYGSDYAVLAMNDTPWDRQMYMTDIAETWDPPRDNVILIPAIAGTVMLAYHIRGITDLNLTSDLIVEIFNGTITKWDHPAIQKVNPNAILPNETMTVVVRGEFSGTTEIFTAGLSRINSDWNRTYGVFSDGALTKSPWKPFIKLFGSTNRGVAGLILSTTYSIGYLSVAEAFQSQLSVAHIVDDTGQILVSSLENVQKAMRRSLNHRPVNDPSDLVVRLCDYVEYGEYPLIGYSYMGVRLVVHSETCANQIEIVRFIEWFLTEYFPKSEAWDYKLAALIEELGNFIIQRVLRVMKCNGKDTWTLVEEQKQAEWWASQTWLLPMVTMGTIVLIFILLALCYIAYQRYRLHKVIVSNDWDINIREITVRWSRTLSTDMEHSRCISSPSVATSVFSTLGTVGSPHIYFIGTLNDSSVCAHELMTTYFDSSRAEVRKMMMYMKNKIHHANVLQFFGITECNVRKLVVSEYAQKGTLSDVIQNEKYNIDVNIKFSFAIDIACGMAYLHGHNLIHGMLTQESCYIDQRWNVKVADWQNHRLGLLSTPRKSSQITPLSYVPGLDEDPNVAAKHLLWAAPEVLRSRSLQLSKCTKASDVYSYAIILVEIFTREDPYAELLGLMKYVDIIDALETRQIRPNIYDIHDVAVQEIIQGAWDSKVDKRPSFSQLRKMLQALRPSKKNIMDAMMDVVEEYVQTLEEKVQERTAELQSTNKNLETLLHQILPSSVASQLMRGEPVEPESYDCATLFFSDIVEFTSLSAISTPLQIVILLNNLYTIFDLIIERHDVYKVETIGDAYMCISGLPNKNGDLHALHIATMALEFIAAVTDFSIPHRPEDKIRIRAGIHSGPVVSGVVGSKMPRYCLFGDSVNTASRMESTSMAMKIQASETTHALLTKIGGFDFSEPRRVAVKGKGDMMTFFLLSRHGYQPQQINTSVARQPNGFYPMF